MNTLLGALILGRQEGDFVPSDSDFVAVLSGQASIALENARLFAEIQKAYKELQTLDHMKSEFINIAAHELRTPLAILIGYASVLEEEMGDSPHGYVPIINRNAMRLRALIEDMLNLKYLESGVPTLSHDKLDLQEVIEAVPVSSEPVAARAIQRSSTASHDVIDHASIVGSRAGVI